MAPAIYTGLFIPEEKQSIFMLAFEEALINFFCFAPLFGPPTKKHLCEIKFNKIKSNQPGMSPACNLKNAKEFLKKNLHILNETVSTNKKHRKRSISNGPTPIIDLSRTVELPKCIDLTESEPEIIDLDRTIIEMDRTLSQLNDTLNCAIHVDDTDSSIQLKRTKREKEDIQILAIKNNPNCSVSGLIRSSSSDNESSFLGSTFKSKKRKFNINDNGDLTITLEKSSSFGSAKRRTIKRTLTQSKIVNPRSPILEKAKRTKKKKKELQDIVNIQTASPSLGSHSSPSPKQLSDGVLKYYTFLDKALNNVTNRVGTVRNRQGVQSVFNKSKTKQPMNKNKRMNGQKQNMQRPINSLAYNQPFHPKTEKNSHIVEESNIFNPNPCVDIEGLRPVAIDGSNVAIGHGKGKFSIKGLKICVDYFFSKGHRIVKVFLPQYRHDSFTAEMLNDLRTKCDLIFTPTTYIEGVRKTPYDDRFIVQYAVEFGGVIVSTDNYRDLLRENRRWKETIEKRLLMFTWVDDFLMFPMDPLGRDGPTLDQFLKF